MKPTRIIWHHSADPSKENQFTKINTYHASRGFPSSSLGYNVGYHYLIEASGEIKKAREETEIGAHDAGENLNSIGICFAGNFNTYLPTLEQAISGAKLVADIRNRRNIPLTRIEPHRWDDTTDCPGWKLPDNWLINEYLQREGSVALRAFYYIGKELNLL